MILLTSKSVVGIKLNLCGGGLLCGSRRRAAGRVHIGTCGRCESGGRHESGVCTIHDHVGGSAVSSCSGVQSDRSCPGLPYIVYLQQEAKIEYPRAEHSCKIV